MWSDLSTRHLLALRAVASEGTIGRAAQRLGFTASAVSQQIAALEQLVGQPLFDRPAGPRPPRLTPAGELMLRHANELIERFEDAEHDLDRFARGVSGTLSIGTFQSVSARLLPLTLRLLRSEAPDVDIELIEGDVGGDFQVDAVLRGDVDLAFVMGEVDQRVASRFLGSDPHVVLVPQGHRPGTIDVDDLRSQPMVGQPGTDVCGLLVDVQLERLGVTPRYVFRSHDNGAIQAMVSAGVGIAVLPLLAVDTSDATISVRRAEPALEPRTLSIVWDPERTPAPIAARFIDVVADVCGEELAAGNAAFG